MKPTSVMVIVLVFAAAFGGTWLVRRYALARLLDVPTDRSMHTTPMPRGGGLAIALAAFGGLIAGGLAGWIDWRSVVGFVVGGAAIALIGWVDDLRGVSARARMTVHIAASAFAVIMLGGFPLLNLGFGPVHLGWFGGVLAVVGITWAINFFNFMDGIDGIAGVEAATVAIAGGALLVLGGKASLGWMAFVIAAAVLGFLPWNWSPARIFMGDVGSGLLGFFFGVLAVASENDGGAASTWGLLLGVFVVDATITFCRRLLRGERVYEAHRKHAYQRLVLTGLTHRQVCALVLLVNAGLAVMAYVATRQPQHSLRMISLGLAALGAMYLVVERRQPFGG
jgi:Fuc2NAc and GlcNAc transferase